MEDHEKMESNKEFITRMYLLVNELPKEKIEDYENILSLLSFQLKLRDITHISNFTQELSDMFNGTHAQSTSKQIFDAKLKALRAKTRYTFSLPKNNQNRMEKILGSKRNKTNPDNLKS